MLVIQILILSFILLPVPMVVGTLFARKYEGGNRLFFSWVSGQILLWAGFHLLSIPLILKKQPFTLLIVIFGIYTAVLFAAAVIISVKEYKQIIYRKQTAGHKLGKCKCRCFSKKKSGSWKWTYLLWLLFAVLLLLQLVLTVVMAYEEGDDAFYVSISVITDSSDTMYRILPYTGWTTELDARHGLAPFPVWVAWLARISGIHAGTVAQVFLPLGIITMTYAIYYLIAERLFADKKENIPFFMILAELLILFGGYSVFSAENFLLVRASQGKAVVANIIIPFLLLLFICLLEWLQQKVRIGRDFWILTGFTMIAGCLCSTQGTILTCMMLGVCGLCTVCGYRKWKLLLPMILCGVIPMGMAFLYFVYR